jgi:hypothetical protein
MTLDENRPYPRGIAFDEAWRQRQRADALEREVERLQAAPCAGELTEEQRNALRDTLETIDAIDDSDVGEACRRVAKRRIAEVLGLDLVSFRLLRETEIKPLYCKRQYASSADASTGEAAVTRQCYRLVSEYYGDKRAERSGVRYMNHIDEGLIILDAIGATQTAKDAYCLHPILQDDELLRQNMSLVGKVAVKTVTTAMEYRNVANRGLLQFQLIDPAAIYLGPLKDVHDMLIADKVQNRKDFLKHHLGTHPKSKNLDLYFQNWLKALGVTEDRYHELAAKIDTDESGKSKPTQEPT